MKKVEFSPAGVRVDLFTHDLQRYSRLIGAAALTFVYLLGILLTDLEWQEVFSKEGLVLLLGFVGAFSTVWVTGPWVARSVVQQPWYHSASKGAFAGLATVLGMGILWASLYGGPA